MMRKRETCHQGAPGLEASDLEMTPGRCIAPAVYSSLRKTQSLYDSGVYA
jgi:hypothetical protein